MLILGHVGTALGAIQISEAAGNRWLPQRASAFLRVADYRFVAIGALLPDLIDKPLTLLDLGASRWIGHSLALALLLSVLGFISFRYKRKVLLLSLATGCFFHLVQDGMWGSPEILLWPAFGWVVPDRGHLALREYLSVSWLRWWEPLWLYFELLGGLVIFKLLFTLRREGRLNYFFHTGRIQGPKSFTGS